MISIDNKGRNRTHRSLGAQSLPLNLMLNLRQAESKSVYAAELVGLPELYDIFIEFKGLKKYEDDVTDLT